MNEMTGELKKKNKSTYVGENQLVLNSIFFFLSFLFRMKSI